ncbi:transcription termination/antitermination protein NusA [Candidatus Falkowbacteria bacterium]|nr:transcription termination/antitermination protein NusA [Candidatus Falkowbacteria bacterium]
MDNTSIKAAIKQICAEKGLSEESVIETINSALAAAYRKDFGDKLQNVVAEFDLETGKVKVFDVKEVVEDLTPEELAALEELKQERERIKEAIAKGEITADELKKMREDRALEESTEEGAEGEEKRRFNPRMQIQLKDARAIDVKYQIGDLVKTELEIPGDFGRMAAQTAKQVIIQKLREAERNIVYQDYKDKEGLIVAAMVQKFDGKNVIVDLDRTTALLPPNEQIRGERYRVGDRIKVYIASVMLSTRGPEIIVSRAHPDIVKMLFRLEIPEIASGVIEIKGIAREAGGRTKVAVFTEDAGIDPIGSCIGQRGARIQTIIRELNGEKIDIIEYSDNPVKFIANALLPAKVGRVEIDEQNKAAAVTVPQDQLSLTIGRAGQNVRLASKLTGWRINIKEQETGKEIGAEEAEAAEAGTAPAVDGANLELSAAPSVVEPAAEKVGIDVGTGLDLSAAPSAVETADEPAPTLSDVEKTEKPKRKKRASKKIENRK